MTKFYVVQLKKGLEKERVSKKGHNRAQRCRYTANKRFNSDECAHCTYAEKYKRKVNSNSKKSCLFLWCSLCTWWSTSGQQLSPIFPFKFHTWAFLSILSYIGEFIRNKLWPITILSQISWWPSESPCHNYFWFLDVSIVGIVASDIDKNKKFKIPKKTYKFDFGSKKSQETLLR